VHQGRKLAMIANVATHPGFRRRGIGRALTERAMLGAWQKGAKEIWLQVRDDNPTAIRIYAGLGFEERARRTTYQSRSTLVGSITPASPAEGSNPAAGGRNVRIGRPGARYWRRQLEWLQRAHPAEISWYSHWDWNRLGPGLSNSIYRLLVQYDTRQWAATDGHNLLAAATWAPAYRSPNTLWLAAAPDSGAAVTQVLTAARQDLAHYRKLTVEYPANELTAEIEAAGFSEYRTLLWMRATGVGIRRTNERKEI